MLLSLIVARSYYQPAVIFSPNIFNNY